MSALRVTFVDQVGAAAGGAEQSLATFLKHLPAGIAAHVILFEDGAFAQRLRELGLDVDVVPVPDAIGTSTRERMRLGAALALPVTALRIAGVARRKRADVLYSNSMKAHLTGALAARWAGIPCVMHFHDIVDGAALTALRSAARVGSRERIACSQTVADHIKIGTTTAIYAPIELASYAGLPHARAARAMMQIPDDGLPLVSIVGRINRWKGHDRFLRIAARVNAVVPTRFAIVGAPIFRDADFLPELQTLVDTLGLRERVTFVPWLDDVRTIYAATDVNANCSVREPFGRAVVEAAACGVPSVCFDDSGAAETIVDGITGRTIAAGDEAAFAAAVIAYVQDATLLSDARTAAREGAGRFDAPRIAAEVERVIVRAAGRVRAAA